MSSWKQQSLIHSFSQSLINKNTQKENPKDEAISGCNYNKEQDNLVGSKQRKVQLAVSNKAKLVWYLILTTEY